MSTSEIKTRLDKLESICTQLTNSHEQLLKFKEEFPPLQEAVNKLIDTIEPDVSALKEFRIKHQSDVSNFTKEMKDFREYLKQQELSSNPTLSQVLQSLSTELMTSRAADSQAIKVFTRLMETTINKILTIPDASFFSFF